MKASLFSLLIFFAITANSQTRQPFSSIGKKVKVVTLTNGKYDEFFDENSLQRVGSSVINIKTKKITKIRLSQEEIDELENAQASRFLSVDPLAKSFAWNSPYSYAENDVIRSIDLDGTEKFVMTDGPCEGCVVIELVNYNKRPPEFTNQQTPGTYTVEDKRKISQYPNKEVPYFPETSVQALFGATFINDAGIVYQLGDPRYAATAASELNIRTDAPIYNNPKDIKADPAGSPSRYDGAVKWIATFSGVNSPLNGKQGFVMVENPSTAINGLGERRQDFGKGTSTTTEVFNVPASDAPVKVNMILNDNGTFENGFSILGSNGKIMNDNSGKPLTFQSTSTEHSRSVDFTVPSGSSFSIKVTGSATNKNDNYSVSGAATTTTKKTYLVPE